MNLKDACSNLDVYFFENKHQRHLEYFLKKVVGKFQYSCYNTPIKGEKQP